MRDSRLIAAALVAAASLVAAACNSTQPTQNSAQEVRVTFGARALNGIWDCWDKDLSRGSGTTIYCEQRFQGTTPVLEDRVVPWQYSIEVSILPAGSVTETVVGSSATEPPVDVPNGFPIFGSLTNFDIQTESGRVCPTNDPNCVPYHNPRSVSQGSRDVTTFNNVSLPEPNILGRPDGCSSSGDPSCGYVVNAGKGDTIIVRARKTLRANLVGVVQTAQDPELRLSGQMTVNGVLANSLGTTSSDIADGAGVVFSYTVR